MMTLAQRDERTYVGGAAIVARHVAALGAHAFLLSSGGGDERTRKVTQVLDAEGVASHLIESRPTVVEKIRYLADDSKLFKVDCGSRLPLDSVAERRAALLLEQQSKVADAVIFCDFGYGMITGGLLARVLPTLRHNARVLTADVSGGRANMLHFRNVDLLCPTERELRMTLNDFDSGLSSVAWDVLQQTQARHLFVTLEKRGLVVFERRSQDRRSADWSARLKGEQLPSFADYPLDRLGCGDALLAAATLALAAGGSPVHAAYLGNAAAAIEISMLGNHPVDAGRILEWLRGRRELVENAGTSRRRDAVARTVDESVAVLMPEVADAR
jgi:rfaE bifunctional protein kinase chain/domain